MKGYPTDEELNFLIEQLEEQELYAPRHLKEEIMNRAFPKQTEQAQPKNKSGVSRPIAQFTYRLKIVAGMAAALIMLMLIPLQPGTDEAVNDEVRWQKYSEAMDEKYLSDSGSTVNSLLNEGTRRISNKFQAWFGRADEYPQNSLFEMMGSVK